MKYIPTIIIVVLVLFILYLLWNNGDDDISEKKVIEIKKEISTPEIKESKVDYIYDTIKLKPSKVQLDSIKRVLELKYKDSISILNALAESQFKLIEETKFREYSRVYNTDLYTLNIKEYVRGYLDKREFDLTLKPQKLEYIETHTETFLKPKYSLYYGLGVNSELSLNINIGIVNSKGNYFGLGVDSNQNFSFDYKHRFFTKY